jgi:enoyl-CoA hydratase/carnithine racemase
MDGATAAEAVVAFPAPTLTVIERPCFGGGLDLAVQCDLRRLAAAGARLAVRWLKRLARRARRTEALTAEDWREPLDSCDSADYREGICAFLAKERPDFRGQ